MSIRQIRAALRAKFGHRGYRITRDGQVHYRPLIVGHSWRYYGTLRETVSDIERGIL
jgi:hypothetical protein